MTSTQMILVALNTLAVVAPLWGLFSLYRLSIAELDGYSEGAARDDPNTWFVSSFVKQLGGIKSKPKRALRDVIFIGGGILAGGIANIWSLFT